MKRESRLSPPVYSSPRKTFLLFCISCFIFCLSPHLFCSESCISKLTFNQMFSPQTTLTSCSTVKPFKSNSSLTSLTFKYTDMISMALFFSLFFCTYLTIIETLDYEGPIRLGVWSNAADLHMQMIQFRQYIEPNGESTCTLWARFIKRLRILKQVQTHQQKNVQTDLETVGVTVCV